MNKPILICENISLDFRIGNYKGQHLKDLIINNFSRNRLKDINYFSALKRVNFELYEGDRLAIIGNNGAGKSTLLKIICQIYSPTKGRIITHEKITPLIEAGAGFHPECTGRENIYLFGSINRFSRKDIELIFDQIVDFAEVRRFIDMPIKYYSTGMYNRLAFSLATALKPNILVIDELFSGGDNNFIQKGEEKINQFIQSSKALILVSHQHENLRKLCNRFLWLDKGGIKDIGDITVLNRYLKV